MKQKIEIIPENLTDKEAEELLEKMLNMMTEEERSEYLKEQIEE